MICSGRASGEEEGHPPHPPLPVIRARALVNPSSDRAEVGGYYGGATASEIMRELQNGPVVVSLEPKSDLMFTDSKIVGSQKVELSACENAFYGTYSSDTCILVYICIHFR